MRLLKKLNTAELLILAVGLVGVLHHIDDVLRFDHSGWPFKPEVNTFTFTFIVYPLAVLIFAAERKSLTRVVVSGLLFLGPTLAHLTIEPPQAQYTTWAAKPNVNLLGAGSQLMGSLAVLITFLLSASSFAAFIMFLRRWWHQTE